MSLIAVILLLGSASGQNAPMLAGSGYDLPKYLTVAPGQVMTLQVTGLTTVLPSPVQVITTPLPTALAGISVALTQYTPQKVSLPVPLMGISQRNYCSDSSSASPDCLITFLTVQVPFELVVFENPITGGPPCPVNVGGTCPQTEIQISENGVSTRAFSVMPVGDNIHILTDCDLKAFASTAFAIPSQLPGRSSAIYPTCRPIATHADGEAISYASPAVPSEIVVLYAWGVGPTQPAVKTGEVTPAPASPTWANDVQFNFSPNAGPSKPYAGIFPFTFEFHPRFIGLVQGQIGLYQINVKLPDAFPSVQRCDQSGIYGIQSNLTITIGGIHSFDGAAICSIQPGA